MAAQKDDLSKVYVTGKGFLEQVVYHSQYELNTPGECGFAVAIVRPHGAGNRRRVAMRWCDEPKRPLGFPQSSARSAWFEVPTWLEEAVLTAASKQTIKEIAEEI